MIADSLVPVLYQDYCYHHDGISWSLHIMITTQCDGNTRVNIIAPIWVSNRSNLRSFVARLVFGYWSMVIQIYFQKPAGNPIKKVMFSCCNLTHRIPERVLLQWNLSITTT